jgi:hypothetical protein
MLLGILGAIGVGVVTLYFAVAGDLFFPGAREQALQQIQTRAVWRFTLQDYLVFALVGAPLVESLVFPPLYWLTRRLPIRNWSYAIMVGLVAWVWHGMTHLNLGQGLGFVVLAAYYAELRVKYRPSPLLSPLKLPYLGIVIAHVTWNAAVVWPLFVLLIPGVYR